MRSEMPMRSLHRLLPTSPGSDLNVGLRVSANPVGTAALDSISPPGYSGDDESMMMLSDGNPTRPERSKSLLIGDEGFSEKGMTPESGGGPRKSAGNAV